MPQSPPDRKICGGSYIGGIPVPGRSVPVLRLFENYSASCRPKIRGDFGMDQLAQILNSLDAEEVAKKIYSQLFFSMGDVQLEKLMGKWYTVVDTAAVHPEECAVHYFELLLQTKFTGTFSSLLYASLKGETVTYQGFGRMVGPDPGEVFYTTGYPSDPCPYFPVKMGGLNSHGEYEYMILSQPLKYPTFVLARNMHQFEYKYKSEVYSFLEKHGFLSPIASLNTRLRFENATTCTQINRYYDQMQL
ncbi:hypothetical protein DICVIV_04315 [Dictyocaulus viviparus]|uniref:Lipocalin domain-containing protein n=1 Tax=Dictyocaulus viviparus TaxID=29172 RepID=A0A0D8XY39_DICVI|nr:hypothetical protein DICVIV_04315 [Dictyocaulus viviparus]